MVKYDHTARGERARVAEEQPKPGRERGEGEGGRDKEADFFGTGWVREALCSKMGESIKSGIDHIGNGWNGKRKAMTNCGRCDAPADTDGVAWWGALNWSQIRIGEENVTGEGVLPASAHGGR